MIVRNRRRSRVGISQNQAASPASQPGGVWHDHPAAGRLATPQGRASLASQTSRHERQAAERLRARAGTRNVCVRVEAPLRRPLATDVLFDVFECQRPREDERADRLREHGGKLDVLDHRPPHPMVTSCARQLRASGLLNRPGSAGPDRIAGSGATSGAERDSALRAGLAAAHRTWFESPWRCL